MKAKFKFVMLLLTAMLLSVLLAGCFSDDSPPDDGTPSPPKLSGIFSSEYGTLEFNGDGRSIKVQINDEFAKQSGLPAGQSEGIYVFLFHNEEYRYDKAEYFRIMIGEKNYQFNNGFGETGENSIVFSIPDGNGKVVFEKND